mmetsp:Transcript_13876/g.30021  ORF Transcript_13876/g.30021 Transcript_13876/m.30021 type:complete len:225 (-) Transcript_13876:49-723(-)
MYPVAPVVGPACHLFVLVGWGSTCTHTRYSRESSSGVIAFRKTHCNANRNCSKEVRDALSPCDALPGCEFPPPSNLMARSICSLTISQESLDTPTRESNDNTASPGRTYMDDPPCASPEALEFQPARDPMGESSSWSIDLSSSMIRAIRSLSASRNFCGLSIDWRSESSRHLLSSRTQAARSCGVRSKDIASAQTASMLCASSRMITSSAQSIPSESRIFLSII